MKDSALAESEKKPSRSRVLVIDDDRFFVETVKIVLERQGIGVLSAEDGPEGLNTARSEKPDLIILDRQMPEMDGNEVLKILKSEDRTRNIPVMMLTGVNSATDIVESLNLGAQDYIIKPFTEDDLLVRITRMLI